jgi:hypothetical protein
VLGNKCILVFYITLIIIPFSSIIPINAQSITSEIRDRIPDKWENGGYLACRWGVAAACGSLVAAGVLASAAPTGGTTILVSGAVFGACHKASSDWLCEEVLPKELRTQYTIAERGCRTGSAVACDRAGDLLCTYLGLGEICSFTTGEICEEVADSFVCKVEKTRPPKVWGNEACLFLFGNRALADCNLQKGDSITITFVAVHNNPSVILLCGVPSNLPLGATFSTTPGNPSPCTFNWPSVGPIGDHYTSLTSICLAGPCDQQSAARMDIHIHVLKSYK